jgi:hypothetical protein
MESMSHLINKSTEKFLIQNPQAQEQILKPGAGLGSILGFEQPVSNKNVDDLTASIAESDSLNLFDKRMSMQMINASGIFLIKIDVPRIYPSIVK